MLIEDTRKMFDESNIAVIDKFLPFYDASIACHLLNLENKEREFYVKQNEVQDLRLHMFFVAPPGYSKSLMLRTLLGHDKDTKEEEDEDSYQIEYLDKNIDKDYSALGNADIKTNFEQKMNEASYVGTIVQKNGAYRPHKGAAFEHKESILGVEEFSVITDSMKSKHGRTLDKALLESLDHGYLMKRLAHGKISYLTNLTLWSCSQPLRFDLSSGLGRRFFFIYFIPTREEEKKIRDMARRNEKSYASNQTLDDIAEDIELIKANASKVQNITYSDKIYEVLDEFGITHFEENLFRKLALGYNFATREHIERDMMVCMNDELEELFRMEAEWRREIKKGPDVTQVIRILKDRGGVMEVSKLKNKLIDFGLSFKQATKALRELKSAGMVKEEKEETPAGKTIRTAKLLEKS